MTAFAIPEFDPVRHEYFVGDKRMDSVTEILKAMGLYKISGYGYELKYRQRGEAVHLACLDMVRGEYDPDHYDPIVHPYADAFGIWARANDFIPDLEYCEKPLACVQLGYAGKSDMVGTVKVGNTRQRVLREIKTGASVPLVGLQMAAYKYLLEGIGCPKIESCGQLNLHDGRCFLSLADEPKWMQLWICCVNLWNLKKEYKIA